MTEALLKDVFDYFNDRVLNPTESALRARIADALGIEVRELTLGERLARQQVRGPSLNDDTERNAEESFKEMDARIRLFFEQVAETGKRRIAANMKLSERKMPHDFVEYRTSARLPWEPQHSHYATFTAIEAKLKEDGLRFKTQYDHDGVGIHSWYTVTLQPVA